MVRVAANLHILSLREAIIRLQLATVNIGLITIDAQGATGPTQEKIRTEGENNGLSGDVRFEGDADRAGQVYAGLTPLSARDVAEVIGFAISRPSHVNLDTIVLKPRDQASAARAFRRT